MAKQHDDEFLERHNGDMDVLLIFVSAVQLTYFFKPRLNRLFEAGLFSAVSSAFIVNMESGLSPNPSDTTNALLKILINKLLTAREHGVWLESQSERYDERTSEDPNQQSG